MSAADRQNSLRMTRIAFSAILVTALSLIGNIYQAQLPREMPYVIRESGNGSTDSGSLVRTAERPDVPWIKYQLARWISEARSLTSDPHIQTIFNTHTASLLLSGSSAASVVGLYYQHAQLISNQSRVGVQMNFVRQRSDSDHVYEADWTETTIDNGGHIVTTEHWNALISIDFSSGNISLPSGDDPDYSNPYGMYIRDLSWSRESN